MSVEKINSGLPTTKKIDNLSDQIIEVNGKMESNKFDKNEIDILYTSLGISRKYLRNQSLGHTLLNYTNWTHLHSETGYSIWKYSPTNYKYNILNQLFLDDKILVNKGEANSESATSFDNVYLYNGDSGSEYIDNTSESSTEEGTEFSLMNSDSDYLYLGEASTFSGAKFEFQTRGSYYTLKTEYWNGSNWVELTENLNSLDDGTSNFESDGLISWVIPEDWATTTVNSVLKYWIRISTTTVPNTVAKAYYIIPGESVLALLALSSSDILYELWAWCSYGSSIYVTIRNSGTAAYEGNTFITSSSSSTNLQNFFIYNHEFKINYENSTYVADTVSLNLDDLLDVSINSGITDGEALVYNFSSNTWINQTLSFEPLLTKGNLSSSSLTINNGNNSVIGSGTTIELNHNNIDTTLIPFESSGMTSTNLYDAIVEAFENGGGGSMVYPDSGIVLSTGSAWGTSITDNHTNWDTAYSWGNHASAGYASLTSPGFITSINPSSSDAASLGTTSLMWSDLFLANGGIINFNNGNYTLTHSAGLLTTNGNFSIGVSNALTAGTIELGNASDTTLSRSAAGVIAVEGVVIPSISSTNTFTNKRVTPRVGSTGSSATPTINTDDYDTYSITALAANITSFTTNLSGTPTNFQKLIIRIKDDGTSRTIAWGASFASRGAVLPTATTISKVLSVGLIYNTVTSTWDCIAVAEEA